MSRTFQALAVALVVTMVSLLAVGLWWKDPIRFKGLTIEDGVVESATFVLYLLAAALMAMTAVRTRRARAPSLLLWGFAVLFFFVAGEEISWGQRFFGWATPPELKAVNVQGETTIHNINLLFQDVRMMGLAVIGFISFGIPLLHYWSTRFQWFCRRFGMPLFPLWAGSLPIAGALFMAVPRLTHTYGLQPMDEFGEFLLSMAMCLFAANAYIRRAPLSDSDRLSLPRRRKPVSGPTLKPL